MYYSAVSMHHVMASCAHGLQSRFVHEDMQWDTSKRERPFGPLRISRLPFLHLCKPTLSSLLMSIPIELTFCSMAALLQHRVQGTRILLKRQVVLRLGTDVNITPYICVPKL